MNWTKHSLNLVTILLSVLLTFFMFELVYKGFFSEKKDSPWGKRYMLFKDTNGGTVFNNQDGFFVYGPNNIVESTTFYHIDDEWVKEYDYIIPTNNLGLVQTTPTITDKDSLLILGDSFTEGQGSFPWFEAFRDSFSSPELQLINGGVFGTGFRQWEMLHDNLIDKGVAISRLVVVFISDDAGRTTWMLPEHTLTCLKNYKDCKGPENFYHKPPQDELFIYLEKLKRFRDEYAATQLLKEKKKEKEKEKDMNEFQYFFKEYMPGTKYLTDFLINEVPSDKAIMTKDVKTNFNMNKNAIKSLISRYNENIIFVHIPQKNEIKMNVISDMGTLTTDYIKSQGGYLFDGHKECGFIYDDYMPNDGHPNHIGYDKISSCISSAIFNKWGL